MTLSELKARVDGASVGLTDLLPSEAVFWAKVRTGPETECWPWLGYTVTPAPRRLGYGRWSFRKARSVRAHRAAWMLHNKADIPPGMCICHACDNPPCCNPAHLFLGTPGDNNRDRTAKGRTVRLPRAYADVNYARGQRHGSSKLTEQQVRSIRSDTRLLTVIAAEYGISTSTASRVRRGIVYPAALIEQEKQDA